MKVTKKIKVFVMVIITAFLLQIAGVPASSHAQWVDRSDDLPGMADDSTISTLSYVAVGLAVIGLVYWIVKANKNKHVGTDKDGVDKPLDEKQKDDGDSSSFKDNEDKTLVMDLSPNFE